MSNRHCCGENFIDDMQRAFSLLPRLKPISAATRSFSLAPLRWASSMAMPNAHALPSTSAIHFAVPGKLCDRIA
jgi:hypothetical protein